MAEEKNNIIDELEDKFGIEVKGNKSEILHKIKKGVIIGTLVLLTFSPALLLTYYDVKIHNFYESKITTNTTAYNINDIYVVYNTDKLYICERDVVSVYQKGNGMAKLYAYYDIKTGEQVHQDGAEGFVVENLYESGINSTSNPVLTVGKMFEKQGYTMSYDELVNELNVDNIISRGGLRR